MEVIENIEKELKDIYEELDRVALFNQEKVLAAFRENEISDWHFNFTTGYGYDDIGRNALSKLVATIFKSESAIASPLITSGTQAISLMLYATLFPGDTLLSVTGKPYDTLNDVINKEQSGSLKDYKIKYDELNLDKGRIDYKALEKKLKSKKIKVAFITRSRGYSLRNSFTIADIKECISFIKNISPNTIVIVDNCYGEFVERQEPTEVGADLVAGSFIKNIGGGIARTGGYVAGKTKLVEMAANRLTVPSLGFEVGSYKSGYDEFFQGIFLAPSVVRNAVKSATLFANTFASLGYETIPRAKEQPNDVIASIILNDKERLIKFCQSIQKYSPINSNVTPLPYAMPGYDDEVIMAAGTFVQGASIELTSDAPVKEPYVVYVQGGLTYEHSKIAIQKMLESNKF